MVTECAFGQLKGRSRVLYRKCESRVFENKCIGMHSSA